MSSHKNPFKLSMVRMRIPDNMSTSISVGGFEIEAEPDRTVEVPVHLAAGLEAHGLTKVVEGQSQSAPAKK
jgi:hypothetical protein